MLDYVTLLLMNMAGGLLALACCLFSRFEGADRRKWAAPFAVVGFVALAAGFHMTLERPLPGSYSLAFGEMSILLGASFLGVALALAKDWSLWPMEAFTALAGFSAIVVGVRMYNLHMTQMPWLTCVGFFLSGLGGICAIPLLSLSRVRPLRIFLGLMLAVAALIWVFIGSGGYWVHLKGFADYKPPTMQAAPQK